MKQRPLPLQGWEVSAILAHKKTRFITPLVPQPFDRDGLRRWNCPADARLNIELPPKTFEEYAPARIIGQCPYGSMGQLLWVQEDCAIFQTSFALEQVQYLLTPAGRPCPHKTRDFEGDVMLATPAVDMPRRHSRLTLEVQGVQLLRLSKVRELDLMGEASWRLLQDEGRFRGSARDAFCSVFDRTRVWGVASKDDPLMWVVRFEAIEMNIDKFLEQERAA